MLYLIILDFIWSAVAFSVDFPKFFQIPFWAVPFVVICPIYPLLLGVVWLKKYKKTQVNPYLLAFAAIPSAVFGILAIVFYPALMINRGFQWNDLGQIFWVWFYSAQGWNLIKREKFYFWAVVVALVYLLVKFVLDYNFLTFGYLEVESLTQVAFEGVSIVAVFSSLGVSFLATRRKKAL